MKGKSVQISCSAKGSPVPVIKVSRKKGIPFPAVDEKRFWFHSGNDGYEFGISNVKIDDSGEYICSASSRVGTINSSMVLTVIGELNLRSAILTSIAIRTCAKNGNR